MDTVLQHLHPPGWGCFCVIPTCESPVIELQDPFPELQHWTVFGLGWTGVAAANLAVHLGKTVTATDTRSPEALQQSLDNLKEKQGIALRPEVHIQHGPHHHHNADAVILTQSVKFHEAPAQDALRDQIPVVPEVEFAAKAVEGLPVDLISFGGTDGKTTTVKLAAHIASAQRRTWVGGNSWTPLSAVALQIQRELTQQPLPEHQRGVLVAEISAFQLPPWHKMAPFSASITNIAEDHVEEFFQGDLQAYINAKRALTDQQTADQVAVLNVDDPIVRTWEPALRERNVTVLRTSLASRAVHNVDCAAYRHNGELRLRWKGTDEGVIPLKDLPILGDHNAENTLTALGGLAPLGLDLAAVKDSIQSFRPPHHRLEFVASHAGVEYFDDSKATNTHAAMAGLSAFGHRPLVAIVGGVDKGLDLTAWVEMLRARTRAVVVIGELRTRLIQDYGHLLNHQSAETLEEAVLLAASQARRGDAVVLSPASSSFDMFRGYAHRGQVFQETVKTSILPPET